MEIKIEEDEIINNWINENVEINEIIIKITQEDKC